MDDDQNRSLQVCGGIYMKHNPIKYENPDNQKVPTLKELGFIKDEDSDVTKSKRLTDIIKKISSNRKSKNHKRR